MDLSGLVLKLSINCSDEECTVGCGRQICWLEVERALNVQLRRCGCMVPMVLFTRQCAKECS